jgi:MFS family permease
MGMIGLEGAGGNLYQSVPLSRWFVRLRGKAMSLAFLGIPAGIFVFTPLIQFLINTTGWRSAWLILGGGSSAAIVIIALSVIRKEPESMGLRPDGDRLERGERGKVSLNPGPVTAEYSWTRSEAVRSFTFWSLVVITGLRMLSMSTVGIFRIPFYMDQGISPQIVAWAVSVEAVISAITAFPVGRAMDRFQPRFVAAASLSLFIIVLIVTMNVTRTWHVFAATILFGIMAASFMVIQNALWPDYFGGMHIGSIRGLAMPFTIVFSAIGAPLTGIIKDTTGTYTPAWFGSIGLLAISTALMLMTPKPVRPVQK